MKVSINWIREIIKNDQCSADPMPKGINDLVDKIGAQLGAVETVIDLGKKYQGIVVAKVVSCNKHPNADKLSLCLIDDAKAVKGVKRDAKGLIEVVCGAQNVAAGQLVAWIPPGVTVPSTLDKDPFVLEAREIRGKISNGMIASLKELDLGDNHTGILEIDEPAKPGQPFTQVYDLDDYIIDIENKMFTHRPDCFGMLGVARELAGIQGMVFRSPRWYLSDKTSVNHKTDNKLLSVKNEVPKLVPRFMMQVVKNVKVQPSSMMIQSYLTRVGVRPINNIVDITNYLMLESAQPIHAYDYDKVKGVSSGSQASITVRPAKQGEKLLLLGDKIITLEGGELVIATNKQAIGLAGVMGGAATEVDKQTKNIILEVGTFDMNTTRKTAMDHGLFTDAAARFTKNQSPWQNDRVLARTTDFIVRESGGLPARSIYDLKGKLPSPGKVKTTVSFINQRLGEDLSAAQIKKLLENVEFKVETSGELLKIEAPFWRTDIEIPEDIVEEVGRLYGYDHLPLVLPTKDLAAAQRNPQLSFKQVIREILSGAGANEVLTYSFIHGSLMEKAGQDIKLAFHIKNALSPDLQYYRLSLTPSLLEKIHPNIKAGYGEFGLFELGQAHVRGVNDKEKLPAELDRLALVWAAKKADKTRGAPYYQVKHYLLYLAEKLGIGDFISVPLPEAQLSADWRQAAKAFEPAHSAAVFSGQIFLGLVGEPNSGLMAGLKLPAYTAQAELDLAALAVASTDVTYEPLNRYPSLGQDMTLKVPASLDYAQVIDFVSNFLDKISLPKGYGGNVSPLDIFQKPSNKAHKNVTLRIIMSHPERTLTTAEVNRLLDELAAEAKAALKADRV